MARRYRTNLYVDRDIWDRFKRLCEREGVSASLAIRLWMRAQVGVGTKARARGAGLGEGVGLARPGARKKR